MYISPELQAAIASVFGIPTVDIPNTEAIAACSSGLIYII